MIHLSPKYLLRLAMALTGNTVTQLAQTLGVSYGTLWAILHGKTTRPQPKTMFHLRQLLRLALSDVVPKDELLPSFIWDEIFAFAIHHFWPDTEIVGYAHDKADIEHRFPMVFRYIVNYNINFMRHGQFSQASYAAWMKEQELRQEESHCD
jgi:transcriptional regulator with XRE-family HTH domain